MKNSKFYLKLFIIIIIFLLYLDNKNYKIITKNKKFELNQINKNTKNIISDNSTKFDNFKYYCCFCAMGKKENLYSRELISYYMSIGVEKFIFGDNNFPNTEKLADVLQDYINLGIVDIIEIFGSSIDQIEFYGKIYQKYKNKCKWLTFFDFDEYLVMYSKKGKKIALKEFLSNPIFNKCEAIQFNWLIYGDNGLVYYDNRSSIERFTKPDYDNNDNRLVKSMIRGNINKKVFIFDQSYHQPTKEIKLCNSLGKKVKFPSFFSSPIYKYAYLMHFNTRTAEEFAKKIKRGHPGKNYKSIYNRVNKFFQQNEFTEEKLKVFEKEFNLIFEKFHHIKNLPKDKQT